MISLTNHDSSEVAVRSLLFTQISGDFGMVYYWVYHIDYIRICMNDFLETCKTT